MSYTVHELPSSFMVIRDSEGCVVAEVYPEAGRRVAHQFAAAPELLEAACSTLDALQQVCEMNDGRSWSSPSECGHEECFVFQMAAKLRAAITKAKGDEEHGG